MADELLNLVLTGKKTATVSIILDDEPTPSVGDLSLVLDGRGNPACVIKNEEVYIMKFLKTTIFSLLFALMIPFAFTACSGVNNTANRTFSNIDNEDIPDILNKTVGTVGNVYFSSGISDNEDYNSCLIVTFNDTTRSVGDSFSNS